MLTTARHGDPCTGEKELLQKLSPVSSYLLSPLFSSLSSLLFPSLLLSPFVFFSSPSLPSHFLSSLLSPPSLSWSILPFSLLSSPSRLHVLFCQFTPTPNGGNAKAELNVHRFVFARTDAQLHTHTHVHTHTHTNTSDWGLAFEDPHWGGYAMLITTERVEYAGVSRSATLSKQMSPLRYPCSLIRPPPAAPPPRFDPLPWRRRDTGSQLSATRVDACPIRFRPHFSLSLGLSDSRTLSLSISISISCCHLCTVEGEGGLSLRCN